MQTLFAFRGSDANEMRQNYSRIVREEFYDGELGTDNSDLLDLRVDKALGDPIGLLRVRSNIGISYRRTWSHIRRNNVGVRVIWFVRRGSLKLVRSQNSCSVTTSQCAILDSGHPFFAQATTDEEGIFEATQAVVPARLFFSHLPGAVEFDQPFSIDSEDHKFIGKLLDLLMGEGEHISKSAAEPLVAAFLEALASNINSITAPLSNRKEKLVDKRLADIEAYITKHVTDPDLMYDDVAIKCGISPRYLCYVLKANNTSFSNLLWGQRLPLAKEWLGKPELQDFPIQEIAFRAGFKSAAHFSRMFRAAYNISPKEYRSMALANLASLHDADRTAANDVHVGVVANDADHLAPIASWPQ
jgi:AraC-like DNA-binding protein